MRMHDISRNRAEVRSFERIESGLPCTISYTITFNLVHTQHPSLQVKLKKVTQRSLR